MSFQVQSNAELIYGVTSAIIFGISIMAVFGVYRLGSLPGRIARSRGHPRATAISICGWLGVLIFVIWPIAFLWAHKTPKKPPRRSLTDEDLDDLAISLRETSEQIATLEARVGVHPPRRAA